MQLVSWFICFVCEGGGLIFLSIAFQPPLEKKLRNKRMQLFHHLQNEVYAIEFKARCVYDGNNIMYTPKPFPSDRTVMFSFILSLNLVDLPPSSSILNSAFERLSLLKPTVLILFGLPLHQVP